MIEGWGIPSPPRKLRREKKKYITIEQIRKQFVTSIPLPAGPTLYYYYTLRLVMQINEIFGEVY